MLQSVDVSWPQGNYQPGSETGVFIAATSGDGGSLFTFSTFVEDVLNARARGKEVGFYHFNGGENPEASADYFWAVIAPYFRPGDAVGLDCEPYNGGTVGAWTPPLAQRFWNRLATYVVERLAIYGDRYDMSAAGWGALESQGAYLWLASPGGYPENTPCGEWSHWTILQYSSAGNLDRDESELSFAQINANTMTTGGTGVLLDGFDMATVADLQAVVDGLYARLNNSLLRDTRARVYQKGSTGEYVAINWNLPVGTPGRIMYAHGGIGQVERWYSPYQIVGDSPQQADVLDDNDWDTLFKLATGTDSSFSATPPVTTTPVTGGGTTVAAPTPAPAAIPAVTDAPANTVSDTADTTQAGLPATAPAASPQVAPLFLPIVPPVE